MKEMKTQSELWNQHFLASVTKTYFAAPHKLSTTIYNLFQLLEDISVDETHAATKIG